MSLSEILVFLVVQLKWKNVLVIDADSDWSAAVLRSLNERGVMTSFLDLEGIDTYPWPERLGTSPRFDGYIAVVGSLQTDILIMDTVHLLKGKLMINSEQFWIFGVEDELNMEEILQLFHEGDQVLTVQANITVSRKADDNKTALYQVFQIWSLHSVGNGSIIFQLKISCETFDNCPKLTKLSFEQPFSNFGRRILKVSALGSPPIKEFPLPGKKKWRGYIFRVINILSDIFNFTYTVKESDGRLYGIKQEDGSWTGMIGELIRKSVDIGTGDLSWTLDRNMAVDLTVPIFPESITFIYRTPGFYSRAWILFQDIDFRIWISLSSIMITATCVYCITICVETMCRTGYSHKVDTTRTLFNSAVRSVSSLYRVLLGQAVLRLPKTVSSRTVLGTWLMGSLIFSALYGGSLTSRLSMHKSPRPADNLQSLVKSYPNAILALRNNSQTHSYFMKSDFWREMWIKNMKDNVIPGKYHIEDTMKSVHDIATGDPIYVWIAERSMLVKLMYKYSDDSVICDLYVAKDDIARADWSIALVRNSPFLKQFNKKILRMQRFGLLQKWYKDHWESAQGNCRPNDGLNPTGLSPISMIEAQSNFVVLAVGWFVGTVLLIIERVYHQWETIIR